MAQITYYIYAYNKVKKETGCSNISFSIPTGNWRCLRRIYCQGKVQHPIKKLIVATNKNNILDGSLEQVLQKE